MADGNDGNIDQFHTPNRHIPEHDLKAPKVDRLQRRRPTNGDKGAAEHAGGDQGGAEGAEGDAGDQGTRIKPRRLNFMSIEDNDKNRKEGC